MRSKTRIAAFLGVLISWTLLTPTARAGVSFEFLFNSDRVQSDDQYFLHVAVNNYGYPREVVEPCLPRLHDVDDDLPVVLFVAHESGRPVDAIVDLRARGLSWSVIFGRCSVPYDVLFTDIDRDPGPPYGKAWGYWRKHPKKVHFSDDDIRGLVRVQTAHRVCGVPAYDIARARGRGQTVAVFVADKKEGRGHRWQGGNDDDQGNRGNGRGDRHGDQGHGEGHGHGHGH